MHCRLYDMSSGTHKVQASGESMEIPSRGIHDLRVLRAYLTWLEEQQPRRGVATNNSKGGRSLHQRRFLSNKCTACDPIIEEEQGNDEMVV